MISPNTRPATVPDKFQTGEPLPNIFLRTSSRVANPQPQRGVSSGTMSTAAAVRGQDGDCIVFLGTYTDYSILPHWPHGHKEGDGLVVARWAGSTKTLEPLHTVPIVNPAFMKCVYGCRSNSTGRAGRPRPREGALQSSNVETAGTCPAWLSAPRNPSWDDAAHAHLL